MIASSNSIFEKNVSRPEVFFFIENKAFEGYWILDLVDKDIYINQHFLKKLGYDSGFQSESFDLRKLLVMKNEKQFFNQIAKNDTGKINFDYQTNNQSTVSCEVEFLRVKDYLQKTTSYIFANTKITKIESPFSLHKSLINKSFIHQEIFAELEQLADIGGWEINLTTGEVVWTNQLYTIHEVTDTFLPKAEKALTFYVEEDRVKMIKALQNTIKKSESFDLNCQILTGKNRLKWIRCSGRIFLHNGRPSKIIGVVQDITKQIRQSEKLRLSENTFRGNFEHAAIGMAILDKNQNWLEINNKLCEIIGYSQSEFKNSTLEEITHQDDLKLDLVFRNELLKGIRDNYQVSKRYYHKDGSLIYGIISVSVVRNFDGSPYQYIAQIVNDTENVKSKNKLEQAIKKLQAVFNASTQVSIVATDKNGLIKNFNSGAENLLGYTAAEMVESRTISFLHLPAEIEKRKNELHLPEVDDDFIIFANLFENGFETREWTYIHKNGYEFPVLLTVTEITEDSIPVGYLGVAIDLTEIKKVEKEINSLLEITRDQNERLKNFAHIVSHNLRSHASNFKMLLDLLVHDHPDMKNNEFINYLETASKDLKETICHLNEVVQLNTTLIDNLEVINLHDVIETNIRNLRLLASQRNINIHNNVHEQAKVLGIPAYITSIVFNFLTNAIKYSNPDTASFVTLSCSKNDEFIELTIADNGIGIDLQKNGAKIFGMYKTFHNNADARGIGLFITKNQVEAMGGKIEVESKINEGTTFKIILRT